MVAIDTSYPNRALQTEMMETTATQKQHNGSGSSSSSSARPHVLIFPLPAQGHLNSMLNLAELLALSAQLNLTFLNSQHNHRRLLCHTDIESRFSKYSCFQFHTVPDGLPENHPRSGGLKEIFRALETTTKQSLRDLLTQIQPPVDCIIGDGIMGFVFDVALELQIPMIAIRTISASALWVYYNLPEMIQAGDFPIKGEGDMDLLVTSVPGMEGFLRRRDLPSICRSADAVDPVVEVFAQVTRRCSEVRGLILNTFDDLEGPTLSQIRTKCSKIYTLGPLHTHLNTRLTAAAESSNSLLEVDRSCLIWLDKQPPESVVYVSFGSITTLSREQLIEFWVGLLNSKKRFLWVIRPSLVAQDGEELEKCVPPEISEATKERGCMVSWAPQEEVLAHEAVGGFLTHSGWNSTLESIVEGVPMLCWPFFADQQVNSRFVSEVWKLGMDMKDLCDRRIVEKMVNDLMVERRAELRETTARIAKLAKESVSVGGSSHCNLEHLIHDIRMMSSVGKGGTLKTP